jgi:glycine cleavage system H protein
MRLYTRDHTWINVEGGRARAGLSEYAQAELGDIAYVELPAVGRHLDRGEVACTLDSLKSSSEVYAPVSGTIVEAHSTLSQEENCVLVNRDPLGEGWLFVMEMDDPRECALLLSEEGYRAYIRGEEQAPTT